MTGETPTVPDTHVLPAGPAHRPVGAFRIARLDPVK